MSLIIPKSAMSPSCAAGAAIGASIALFAASLLGGSIHSVAAIPISLALAATGGVLLWRFGSPTHGSQKKVIDNLQLLCQLDHHDLTEDRLNEQLPRLQENSPWSEAFICVRDCLTKYGQQLQDTEQRRAEAEVRLRTYSTERNRYREILHSLSLPILTMNYFGEVVFSNTAANQALGIAEESENLSVDRLSNGQLIRLMKDVRRRKLPAQRTADILLGDEDHEHQFQAVCHGLRTTPEEGDDEHGATVFLEDISELKEIQKRNAQFVSAVSHEMKTPLTSIKAYVELLSDGDAEDQKTRDEFLDVIDSQADRLERLIHNLLNLARIEAGVVDVNKEHLSMNEVLEEAFSVVQPSAEQKKIKLLNDLSPMYIGVLADRDMLQQSAINLLSNAVKYTPEGGAVTLTSRLDDKTAVFEVQDTGVGLGEDDCKMIFKKFYRVNKNMASGTGLGLPLAKHIAEDVHGGTLLVTSELDKGSTFTIRIPSVGAQKK
jgi:two-component system phosphate regulon sensor histidine kinase PhoR